MNKDVVPAERGKRVGKSSSRGKDLTKTLRNN